jgi:acyl-homoserine-lactone acylase
MAVEFTPQGPVSRAFISYSQSADETSPHFADQTELYSRKGWVDLAWRRSAQLADPELRTYRVSGPR